MRLTRGAWFLLGFGLTLAVIWAGASVWTLLEQRDNGNHLTKIERIVIGLKQARPAAPPGGDAVQPAPAGQQPSPADSPAPNQDVDQGQGPPTPAESDDVDAPATPAPTGRPAGEEVSIESTTAPPDEPEPSSGNALLEAPGISVGEQPCPVKALGVSVCAE